MDVCRYRLVVSPQQAFLALQVFMRRNCVDSRAGELSYIGGASTANQRIESWWGVMRKEGIEYWIQLLGELKDQGLLTGNFLDKALSQFCLINIIQEQLNEIKNVWNTPNPTIQESQCTQRDTQYHVLSSSFVGCG